MRRYAISRNSVFHLLLIFVAVSPYRIALAQQRNSAVLEKQWFSSGGFKDAALRANVNLVLVSATVTDRRGGTIEGLRPENFEVLDEGIPQQIISFSQDDAPCSIGLLVDVSGSMTRKMTKVHEATRAFLDIVNPEDEVFLMTFSEHASVDVPFTRDFEAIGDRLLSVRPQGSTALIDAVYLALRQMHSARHARRALLLVTDGGDNHSRYTKKELLAFADEADVRIHVIGIHDHPSSREEMTGPFLLNHMSKQTGGLHFDLQDLNELSGLTKRIGAAIHNQYVIGYYSPASAVAGRRRRIQVKLRSADMSGLQVYARTGYYPSE